MSQYRIADAHAHIYPLKIAAKATEAVGVFYEWPMEHNEGTSAELLKSGAAIGVERYLVCSVATTAKQVDSINRFIASACAENPEFIGLGAYHVDVEDYEMVLDQVEELGLKGIKLHCDFQKFPIDDPRLMPVYESLERRGLCVLHHMGDDRYDFSAPERLVRVMEHTPKLRAIAAHLGGYRRWEDARTALKDVPVVFDESSTLGFLEQIEGSRDVAARKARALVENFGVDRVMFGVDFPMWDHTGELERFLNLGLDEADNRKVLYENFARFFELED